jgi:hypothetical protein
MTTEEFRIALAEHPYFEGLQKEVVDVNLPQVSLNQKFALVDFHRFLSDQIYGWKKFKEENPNSRIHGHLEIFQNARNLLDQAATKSHPSEYKGLIQNAIKRLSSNKSLLTFDAPETDFLIKVNTVDPNLFDGAVKFIVGEVNVNHFNQKIRFRCIKC